MMLLFTWLLVIPVVAGQIQRSEKIINGFDASIRNYPYQVAVFYKNILTCGGSIITEQLIITAAHCVYRRNHKYYSVNVGSDKIQRGIKYNLAKIILHPFYDREKLIFDIAIIKLAESLIFSINVKPIQMQPRHSEVPDGTRAYVSGWGKLQPWFSSTAKKLQAAEVRVISNEKCKKTYNNDEFNLKYYHLCAIHEYRGTCSGDSGGPLIANNKLIGVVSFGIMNCDPPNPGVYVNVSYVRAFIDYYL